MFSQIYQKLKFTVFLTFLTSCGLNSLRQKVLQTTYQEFKKVFAQFLSNICLIFLLCAGNESLLDTITICLGLLSLYIKVFAMVLNILIFFTNPFYKGSKNL